jgi:hypothetical protein
MNYNSESLQFNPSAPPADMSAAALVKSLRLFLGFHKRLCGLNDHQAAAMASEAECPGTVVQGNDGFCSCLFATTLSAAPIEMC